MNETPLSVKIARALLLSTVLVPLIISTSYFFPYIVPRTVFFRTVVEITMGIFIYLLVSREWRIRTHVDLFFWGLTAFVAASGISALFSPARNRAMFGDFERMGGVWSLLHYLMFYALVRVFFAEKEWKLYVNLSLAVSTGVSLLSIYEGSHGTGAQATIGNPGLLALYLFFAVCVATYLAFRSQKILVRALYAAAALFALSGVILSHNRSSLLGLGAAAVAAGIVYFFLGKRHRKAIAFLGTGLVISIGLALTLVTRAPESWVSKHLPATFSRTAESNENRAVLWAAAVDGFRDRPIVGYGPENFHLAWSANFQPKVYTVSTEQRVDRAHNIMLEVLSTTGLLGFIAFLAMWVGLFYSISNGLRKKEISLGEAALFAGISVGYLVSLSFWFIDINSFVPFVGLCGFLAFRISGGQVMALDVKAPIDARRKLVLGAGIVALAMSLWLHSFETLRVSRLLYRTQIENSNMPVTLHAFFDVFDSPAPQSTHTPFLFGRYMGWLLPRLKPADMTQANRQLLDSAFALGLNEMERERNRDPRNELIYLQQSRLALLAGQYYGLPVYYNYAVKALHEAVKLSPRRVQPKLVLGYTLMMGKQFDSARAQLYAAREIYPKSGQIYYYIGELHRLENDLSAAGAALDTSLAYGYKGPPEVYFAVMGGLQALKKYSEAATLGEAYLRAAQPGYDPMGGGRKNPPASAGVVTVLGRLPWLWAKTGDRARAIAAAENFKAAFPKGADNADRFIQELSAGKESSWQRDVSLLETPGT